MAAGMLEGAAGRHYALAEKPDIAGAVGHALVLFCNNGSQQNLHALYSLLAGNAAMEYMESLFNALDALQPDVGRVCQLCRWIVSKSPDREAVRIAVALLGVCGDEDDVPPLRVLSRHASFMPYAGIALMKLCPDYEIELWNIAKADDGWGRIMAVERLVEAQRPEVQHWLLTEGHRNSILQGYGALECARGGRLAETLAQPDLPAYLLDSCVELVHSLVLAAYGPGDGLDKYEAGAVAITGMLGQLERIEPRLVHAAPAYLIHDFLTSRNFEIAGFTPRTRSAAVKSATQLLARPGYRTAIEEALASSDPEEYRLGLYSSRFFEVGAWDTVFARLGPEADAALWHMAIWDQDWDRVSRVIEAARPLLARPDSTVEDTPEYEQATAILIPLVQQLKHWPGAAPDAVEHALRCPDNFIRPRALYLLEEWARQDWTDEMHCLVTQIAERDPETRRQEMALRLLAGQPLSD
jgi:hypothetical protein